MWIGRRKGLVRLSEGSVETFTMVDGLAGDDIRAEVDHEVAVLVETEAPFPLTDPDGKALTPDMDVEVETGEDGVSEMKLFESGLILAQSASGAAHQRSGSHSGGTAGAD